MEKRRKRFRKGRLLLIALLLLLAGTLALKGADTVWRIWQENQILSSADYGETADDGIPWYLLLVNSTHPLPDDWEAPALIEMPGGETVDARIYEPLSQMLADAADEGLEPFVASGFRTRAEQQGFMDEKINEYRSQGYGESEARALAEDWVALPGTSEHELGLAVDINGASYDLYIWLQQNSWRYGFIQRYPEDKTDITGISHEPWHYRYVGKEAAKEIYESGLCLEEYLG